jgi:hypothetical protein
VRISVLEQNLARSRREERWVGGERIELGWTRRIKDEHHHVYQLRDEELIVVQARYYYYYYY